MMLPTLHSWQFVHPGRRDECGCVTEALGASAEAHRGGDQVDRLHQDADVFEDGGVTDLLVCPHDAAGAGGHHDQDLRLSTAGQRRRRRFHQLRQGL